MNLALFALYYSYKDEENHEFYEYKMYPSVVKKYSKVYPFGIESLTLADFNANNEISVRHQLTVTIRISFLEMHFFLLTSLHNLGFSACV